MDYEYYRERYLNSSRVDKEHREPVEPEHKEGDPCPDCATPILVSSMGPGYYEAWCPNDECEWGR
jgi:hypothetical protein